MAIDLNGSTGISLDDNEKINIGNDSDLQIYHNGSNSYVQDAGTGNLNIITNGGELALLTQGGLEYGVRIIQDGAVEIRHDDSTKLATTSTGIDVTGNATFSDNVGIGTSSSLTNLSVAGTESGTLSRVNIDVADSQNRTLTLSEQKITFAAPDTYGTNYNAFINYGLTSLQFGVGNTERMRIDSSGNVGIGVSPSYTLDVYKSSVGNVARFNSTSGNRSLDITSADNGAYLGAEWDRNINSAGGIHTWSVNDAERMRIDSSGNVGIGTSPSANLHLKSTTSGDPELRIEGSGTNNGIITFLGGGHANPAVGMRYISSGDSAGHLGFYANGSSSSTLSERMRISSSGQALINTTADDAGSGARLHITGNSSQSACSIKIGTNSYPAWYFVNASGTKVGDIVIHASSTSYNTSSDYRLKENVVDLTGASARVNQLNPSRFNFIADDTNTLVDGFLAHEVATVVPEAITGTKDAMKDEEYEVTPAVEATYDEDGNELTAAVEAVMGTRSVPDYQGIDQSKLVPLLTAALQEALTEIASLKTRVEALEA